MTGETWNVLAAPPTERELDAALAEVRVRAMVHAQHRIWRTRVRLGAGYVAVALLAGYAGFQGGLFRAAAAADDIYPSAVAWPRSSVRADIGPAFESAAPGSVFRYHVTAWSVQEGQTMPAGEAWIESPAPVTAALSFNFPGAELEWRMMAGAHGDSVNYAGWGTARRIAGVSSRDLPLYEEGRVAISARVPVGRSALISPLRGIPMTATPHIRIDGPYASLPQRPLHWVAGQNGARFANAAQWIVTEASAAVPHRVLLRLAGRPSVIVPIGAGRYGSKTRLPGMSDSVMISLISMSSPLAGGRVVICLSLKRHGAFPAWAPTSCTGDARSNETSVELPGVGRILALLDP